jgi:hypothetical protein
MCKEGRSQALKAKVELIPRAATYVAIYTGAWLVALAGGAAGPGIGWAYAQVVVWCCHVHGCMTSALCRAVGQFDKLQTQVAWGNLCLD